MSSKISQLNEATTVLNTDVLPIVNGGETKKVTKQNLLSGLINSGGWVAANETWAYASDTTITVPTDATNKYSKGDKIRLKQGGGYKYFYIIGVAATVLTVTGGTNYTLVNSAITDNYYSKVETPLGFPTWFTYTPTLNGTGGSIGTFAANPYSGRFKISGSSCFVRISIKCTNVGSWTGSVQVGLPFNSGGGQAGDEALSGFIAANGANPVTAGRGYPALNKGTTNVIYFLTGVDTAVVSWGTFVVNDHIRVQGEYEF